MSIVTSIHAYNFHLFISYLGKGVDIIRFEDLRYKFRVIRKDYAKTLEIKTALQEITTYSDQLFGVRDSTVNSFSLLQTKSQSTEKIFPEIKTTQISLDNLFNDLYLLSEDDGIHEINILNPLAPKSVKIIIPESFEKIGDPSISNMISNNRYILLAYRGYGASMIKNSPNESMSEITYRSEDAQDVRFAEKLNMIIVADGIEGLVLFDSKDARATKKIKLFNSDFPQEVRLFLGNILIKGKNGLYLYNFSDGNLRRIWEGSVGVLTTYYNYIFFSSNGQINLLIESDAALSHFQLLDKDRLEIKTNKYLH